MNDSYAFQRWKLSKLLKEIPGPYFVIGDNADVGRPSQPLNPFCGQLYGRFAHGTTEGRLTTTGLKLSSTMGDSSI
ncbi:hypothetical protein PPTG_10586 [Phytophthora nicotianae INRA-310]|uniref:Uncharacterized protein n=1 Tax=Phytophthora nicotianae (strain INRA-310) TaxID=761204 RepID=W2QBC3_PHYN3|nr:hypothetical protein PPTG_10586 [Phytophthora nicotianae INRA-310]ETN10452.1 hypothetical protein PPTG_10586 [Phytophthora nicotianae INRA-310]